MNVKSIIVVVIGLLVSVTAYSQQPKETTIDLLTHTVWEHGKPIYGDYCQISYTDSIVTLLYKNADEIGKRVNGDYYMTIDKSGTFTSFKILELGKDKLAVVAIRVNGGERTPGAAWVYTPLKR